MCVCVGGGNDIDGAESGRAKLSRINKMSQEYVFSGLKILYKHREEREMVD